MKMVKYQKFKDTEIDELKTAETTPARCSTKSLVLLVCVCVCVSVISVLIAFFVINLSRYLPSSHAHNSQILKSEISVDCKGKCSSTGYLDSKNVLIVEEDHELTKSDHLHVIKDYSKKIQIMKISNKETAICYFAPLTAPSPDLSNMKKNKTYSSAVYEVKEIIPADQSKSFNRKLQDLCGDVDTYLLDEVHSHSPPSIDPAGEFGSVSLESGVRRRRNIRQCKTSCCYVVCCCDVKHFVFESDQEFSCVHVCNNCSTEYRKKIQKIC